MKMKALGNVADFINGFAFKPVDWNGQGKKIIRIQNLTNKYKPYNLTDREVHNKYIIKKGDLLVSWSATLGVFEWQDGDALLNQHIFKVVPKDIIHKPYLQLVLKKALLDMEYYLHGATMRHINRKEFLGTQIPIPFPENRAKSLREQKRIAAILNKADAIRKKRVESLQLADEFLKSTFLDMFGDFSDMPENCKRLAELGTQFKYGTSSKSAEQGIPTLRIPNILTGDIDLTNLKNVPINEAEFERLKLFDGDILFVRTNGNPDYVGRCSVFDSNTLPVPYKNTNFIYASYLIRARLDTTVLLPDYLVIFLQTGKGQSALRSKCKTSAGQYNINTQGLGSISVPIPPIEKQQQFSAIVKKQYKMKILLDEWATESNNLFNSLVQRAFKGEL